MFKQFTSVFIGILLFIVFLLVSSSVYIVDETKQVFVTQFGKIVRGPINGPGKEEAGLKFRYPFINEVHAFEKRYLEWDGAPNQVTTKDKLFVFIDTYARWRIVDAKLFFEKVRNESGAQSRLDDLLEPLVDLGDRRLDQPRVDDRRDARRGAGEGPQGRDGASIHGTAQEPQGQAQGRAPSRGRS